MYMGIQNRGHRRPVAPCGERATPAAAYRRGVPMSAACQTLRQHRQHRQRSVRHSHEPGERRRRVGCALGRVTVHINMSLPRSPSDQSGRIRTKRTSSLKVLDASTSSAFIRQAFAKVAQLHSVALSCTQLSEPTLSPMSRSRLARLVTRSLSASFMWFLNVRLKIISARRSSAESSGWKKSK